jgi:glutamyl-Q tRNA(Asp) synthetase
LLHLGHVRSALVGHRWAREIGGRFLLRIEDIDATRCKPEFVAAIPDTLAWLGIDWDGEIVRQSQCTTHYRAAADDLKRAGLLYPCFATRTEIEAAAGTHVDPDGAPLYPGLWRDRPARDVASAEAAGLPKAWRLDMTKALAAVARPQSIVEIARDGGDQARLADPGRWGDVVLVRKDAPSSYHLSVVVDDARQGVTHVTRGRDIEPATDLHRVLQHLLDLPVPLYHHHALIRDADGRKLSKSDGARSIAALRSEGWTAERVRVAALEGL